MGPRRGHVVKELRRREYGVKCTWWSSVQILRHATFGPRRKWEKVYHAKHNCLVELSGDLQWIAKSNRDGGPCSVVQRVSGDGRTVLMHEMDRSPCPKEVAFYDVPDTHFRASVPAEEYQPAILTLRKECVLTRHDLENGRLYNRVHLGWGSFNSMSVSFASDVLVVKSTRLQLPGRQEGFFRFHAFRLHPFRHLATVDIDGSVFPDVQDRSRYGKLRNAEIQDDLLIVMTNKNFSLLYDAKTLMEGRRTFGARGVTEVFVDEAELVREAPPLLFASRAHADILGLGACPWSYIRAVSDSVLEVRDLGTEELLGGGRVTWRDPKDQISPDYLMFHPDDSSRVVHIRTSEIRILAIRDVDGKRTLQEEFVYPKEEQKPKAADSCHTRSGRLVKNKFELDDTLNTAVAFDVETDLGVLVVLEARRDVERNCTRLEKVAFYDSLGYAPLGELDVSANVTGDIETNRLSLHMDRDVLNVVSTHGGRHTVLSYRLKEAEDQGGGETGGREDAEGNLRRDGGVVSILEGGDEGEGPPPRGRVTRWRGKEVRYLLED